MRNAGPIATTVIAVGDALRSVSAHWSRVSEELVFAFTTPAQREAINERINAVDPYFQVDGRWYQQGLRPWEADLIQRAHIPKGGFILIGAAGAGREMVALAREGYRVTGFDPNDLLVAAGQPAMQATGSTLVRAGYADLIELAERGSGALAGVIKAVPDAILLSWGSITYLTSAAERVRLLGACKTIAPAAALLVSMPSFPGVPAWIRDGRPAARGLRRLLWSVAWGAFPERGERFLRPVGFAATVDSGELERLCAESGYELAYLKLPEYAHALLVAQPGKPS